MILCDVNTCIFVFIQSTSYILKLEIFNLHSKELWILSMSLILNVAVLVHVYF